MSINEKRENDGQQYKREQRNAYVRIMLMVNIVFILLLITLGVIALRVNNVLPEDQDIFFVVGKNPSFEIGDGEGKQWKNETNVNIFRSTYKDGKGEAIVISQTGDKVLAPGSTSSYKFAMYNNGNMAVMYETDIDFALLVNGKESTTTQLPLKVRLYTDSGKYLVGSENEWTNINDVEIDSYISQLGASSYEGFTLEVKWDYESGNDELDTLLGNQSAASDGKNNKGVSVDLKINTYAEEHIDPTAKGGTVVNEEGRDEVEHGGTVRILWFILLFINIGMLLFYIAWLLNKRLNKW
ncbi:MAG: hypothetical protein IJW19_03745 [Clostridia bacterium]|nr:hypothetical protein [Clostridia bacterium]